LNMSLAGRSEIFARWTTAAFILGGAFTIMTEATWAQPASGAVNIEYSSPSDPKHEDIRTRLQAARVLEFVRDVLRPIRLPRALLVKLSSCDGVSNAWYAEDAITVCYEFVQDIFKNATDGSDQAGIGKFEKTVGPLLDVFLHEAGHAVFDYLQIPLFGREEDAADQFSTYIMLQYDKDRARRLILGSAYQYKMDVQRPDVSIPLAKFSDEHGLPAQRFFNVLCIAYGSDPQLFAQVVELAYLPKMRAEGCEAEYEQVRFAFETLIKPHINTALARKVIGKKREASKTLIDIFNAP
jgi:hypothetical protein